MREPEGWVSGKEKGRGMNTRPKNTLNKLLSLLTLR